MHHVRAARLPPEYEGMSAVSLQRVVLPTVSNLTANSELHYRLGAVGMPCKEEYMGIGVQLLQTYFVCLLLLFEVGA
jgi:hypothetical protein